MRVLLESTSKTVALHVDRGVEIIASSPNVPTRIWQGRLLRDEDVVSDNEINAVERVIMLATSTSVSVATRESARAVVRKLRGDAPIEVHAFIARIAHGVNEPAHIRQLFEHELQKQAAPRLEYERAYPMRMFI